MTEATGPARRTRQILASVPWVRTVLPAAVAVAALSLALYLATRPIGPPVFSEVALLAGEGPLAFSPDGGTLATGHQTSIRLWDVRTGELTRTIDTTGIPNGLAFSPDGKTIAAVG